MTRADRNPTDEPTFVFVHGGWSSGFNYHQVVTQLVTGGRRAFALDLPGHGQQAQFPASYLSQDLAALETEPSPSADITSTSASTMSPKWSSRSPIRLGR
jgi:pimeloyl-ACP methyl ester carboxylesterase